MQKIKNLLTVLLIGLVSFVNANNSPIEVPTANLKETANEKVRLTLFDSKVANLKIEDATGVVIYDESIKGKNTIAKDYDLTTLADGTYTFSIELSDKIIEQKVSIEAGNITLENANIISKPVFFEGEDALFVTITGLSKANIEVRIIDNLGNEVYQNESKDADKFNVKYDLSDVNSENCTFVVSVDDKTYYQTVNLK